MSEGIRIVGWENLSAEQKEEGIALIIKRVPDLARNAGYFLRHDLNQRAHLKSEKNLALCALDGEKVTGVVVARIIKGRMILRYATSRYTKAAKQYVKQHGRTPVASMVKQLEEKARKERLTFTTSSRTLHPRRTAQIKEPEVTPKKRQPLLWFMRRRR